MAYRFVRARPKWGRLSELWERLQSGDIQKMEPFGESMARALHDARVDTDTGKAVWIEEDYCTPPLAMERSAVLDDYFEELEVVDGDVNETAGWERIDHLPSMWDRIEADG